MSDLTARLDAMQQRCDAASEGPWEVRVAPGDHERPSPFRAYRVVAPGSGTVARDLSDEGADFIAAARTDLPATITALRAVLDLHKPDSEGDVYAGKGWWFCSACEADLGDGIDPDARGCPTVRAITEALA